MQSPWALQALRRTHRMVAGPGCHAPLESRGIVRSGDIYPFHLCLRPLISGGAPPPSVRGENAIQHYLYAKAVRKVI